MIGWLGHYNDAAPKSAEKPAASSSDSAQK
jgi:hypothetical protein